MTRRKNPATGKGRTRSLKIKKETLKDLTPKDRTVRAVKGGVVALIPTLTYCGTQCMCNPTDYCRKCCVGTGAT